MSQTPIHTTTPPFVVTSSRANMTILPGSRPKFTPIQFQSPYFTQPCSSHPPMCIPRHVATIPPMSQGASRYFSGPTNRIQVHPPLSSVSPNPTPPQPRNWSQMPLPLPAIAPVLTAPIIALAQQRNATGKTLLFSSKSVARLRSLLSYGAQPRSRDSDNSDRSIFELAEVSLRTIFDVKQSTTLQADLLLTGTKTVAFIVVTQQEIDRQDQRDAFVRRCTSIRKQHRIVYVIYLKNSSTPTSDDSDPMINFKASTDLPPVMTCSSLEFAVICIGTVANVVASATFGQTT